jgi:ribosome-associated protein
MIEERGAIAPATKGGPLNTATAVRQETTPSRALDKAVQVACVADDNKAKDIVVLDMRELTPLYDFFILMTGTSRRQIHTITEEIDAYLSAQGDKRLGIEGYESSRWVVQDYGDLVVHVFDEETRKYFGLEEFWADAPRIDWQELRDG